MQAFQLRSSPPLLCPRSLRARCPRSCAKYSKPCPRQVLRLLLRPPQGGRHRSLLERCLRSSRACCRRGCSQLDPRQEVRLHSPLPRPRILPAVRLRSSRACCRRGCGRCSKLAPQRSVWLHRPRPQGRLCSLLARCLHSSRACCCLGCAKSSKPRPQQAVCHHRRPPAALQLHKPLPGVYLRSLQARCLRSSRACCHRDCVRCSKPGTQLVVLVRRHRPPPGGRPRSLQARRFRSSRAFFRRACAI
mmetsp:Transcript_98161/g.263841  ORF Transcript_98161/g.263841 Transcript_98161/m.263841 type:complete len:247 (+) Transcript_98161:358-1098(+)